MNINQYEPEAVWTRLQDAIDNFFRSTARARWPDESGDATAQWAPPIDVREQDSRFLIKADIPGVNPEDVEVRMENGVLEISIGKREAVPRSYKTGGTT